MPRVSTLGQTTFYARLATDSGHVKQHPKLLFDVRISDANLHRIWQDFDTKTESFMRRVREGVDVLAASEFARLVESSGLLNLLEENYRDGAFPIHGGDLRRKVSKLLDACNEWFEFHERSNVERALQIPRTQMERVNATLEQIQNQLSKVLVPSVSEEIVLGVAAPLVKREPMVNSQSPAAARPARAGRRGTG